MPLQKCSANGTSGWQYGKSGKCYTGPGAKKKAIKQALAEGGGKMPADASEVELAIAEEILLSGPDRYTEGVEQYLSEAYVSKEERDKMSSEDFGDPAEKKYPVANEAHFKAAVKLLGRAPKEKQAAIKARLKKIAKRKGYALPKTWE